MESAELAGIIEGVEAVDQAGIFSIPRDGLALRLLGLSDGLECFWVHFVWVVLDGLGG